MSHPRRTSPRLHTPPRARQDVAVRRWTPEGTEGGRSEVSDNWCEVRASITSHVGSPVSNACSRSRRKPSVLHTTDDASICARRTPRPSQRIHLRSPSSLASALTLFGLPTLVQAAPLQKRDGSDAVKIIVPVVVVVVIVGLILIMTCMRRGWHMNMARWTSHAANSFGPSTASAEDAPRELTAQQLVGSATDITGEGAPPARTRRSRRANRRASQISTHSLPVYMKEPGEREVVIFRGPEDMMEEPPTTTHVVMPSVAETAESPDPSVVSRIQSREYTEMPESPHDMPLLLGDESRGDMGPDMDNSRARLLNLTPRTDGSRPSVDTLPSTEESPTSRLNPQTPDPRGEAPPYFEVVPLEDMSPSVSPEIPAHVPEPLQEPPESPRRRSGFLGLFHSRQASRSQPSDAATTPAPVEASPDPSHRRGGSGGSNVSTPTIPRPRSRAQSRAGMHRPSVSGSGFSMMSRSRSRLLDSPHLTSPSMISVNSISAPLTHTTVRTEFTYPRSGPTPEQIKLIASRESFARFGVPYGQDAIAFHASTSRMDLPLHPPPDFEEIAGPSRSPILDGGNETTVVEEESTDGDSNEGDAQEPERPYMQRNRSPLANQPVTASQAPAPASEPTSPTTSVAADSSRPKESFESALTSASLAPPPGLGSSSSSPPPVPEVPAATKAKPKSPPPPIRAPSRASSTASFETADESMHTPGSAASTPFASASSKASLSRLQVPAEPDAVSTVSTVSPPATPRVHGAHLQENSDATSTTLTPTTPTTAATEVGRAL